MNGFETELQKRERSEAIRAPPGAARPAGSDRSACPSETDYLFFVVNGKDGGHNFSKSLDEHNKNKKDYFEIRKQNEK